MNRRPGPLRLLLVATLAISGCSVSTNDEPVALGNDLFENLLTTTTTTTSTTAPEAVTKAVTVYFLRGSDGAVELRGVEREIDVDAGVQEILANLFTVRPDGTEPAESGLTSSIPDSAVLVSATITPGSSLLVVDVRGLFGDEGIQGNDLRNALAQIVWTSTESEDVQSVTFRNDGEPVSAIVGSGEISDEPVDRSDYRALS